MQVKTTSKNKQKGSAAAGLLALAALLGLLAAGLVISVNTDLWTKKSSGFSRERFAAIEVGVPIEAVIDHLGEPIGVEGVVPGFFTKPEWERRYVFAGPSRWWPFYTYASVTTDADGRVVHKFTKREP